MDKGSQFIGSWTDFKQLDPAQQVDKINGLLREGHTVKDIMEGAGADRTTLGAHFRRMGYKRIDNQFMPVQAEIKQNKAIEKQPEQAQEQKAQEGSAARKHLDKSQVLKICADVHSIMIDIDTTDYDRTSISIAKSTNKKLDQFVKDLKILKKQDVITVAIEEFLSKYNK